MCPDVGVSRPVDVKVGVSMAPFLLLVARVVGVSARAGVSAQGIVAGVGSLKGGEFWLIFVSGDW